MRRSVGGVAGATGVMREARQERGAEFLELLADNLAAAGAGRGAALVSNIVTGGRQSMSGGTQQLSSTAAMRASLRARVSACRRMRLLNTMFRVLGFTLWLRAINIRSAPPPYAPPCARA